jgi:uncharacterized RDD family membrane protein YckC
MAKLIVNPTASSRREIPLSRSTLLAIGRDPSNDLVLPDAMVSRRHAVVEWRGSQFFLRDCNSSNGSVVNGDRISEKSLRDGDLVAIGTARLLFRDDLAEPGAKVVQHPSSPKLQCPKCSAEYRKGDLFCRECGEKLASASGPPKAICASCGTAVVLPARFCNACGSVLTREGERSDAPGAPEAAPARVAAELPPLKSDEPKTGPPAPAPVLDKPPVDSRPSGSAAVAPALAPAPPAAPPSLERAEPAEVDSARPAEKPRPSQAAARPPSKPHSASSGDRLRAVRPGEASGAPAPFRASAARPPAPLGVRFLAGLADALLLGAAEASVLAPVVYYWSGRGSGGDVAFLPILLSATVLPASVALAVAYYVYFWGWRGATPGQRFFGLTVEAESGSGPLGPGRAALRFLGYLLSAASLGVGFLMIAFTGSGLHDRIAGTRVVRGRPA